MNPAISGILIDSCESDGSGNSVESGDFVEYFDSGEHFGEFGDSNVFF